MKTLLHNNLCKKAQMTIYNEISFLFNNYFLQIEDDRIRIHDKKYCYWFLGSDSENNKLVNLFQYQYMHIGGLHGYWYLKRRNWKEINEN